MKHIFLYYSVLSSLSLYAADSSLICDIVESPNKIIKCTFKTKVAPEDANYIFEWSSESTPQDHRIRTVLLPKNNLSIYDYRNYYGRAKGSWLIQVKDEEENLMAATTFNLE